MIATTLKPVLIMTLKMKSKFALLSQFVTSHPYKSRSKKAINNRLKRMITITVQRNHISLCMKNESTKIMIHRQRRRACPLVHKSK